MIFRQLFDRESCTYTYLIAGRRGGEAIIIDPVLDRVDRYFKLLEELDLRLAKALDTHVHADHISALGALRDRTQCVTVMGEQSSVDVVSMRVADGEEIAIEGLILEAIYTPGHTDDSYSFLMDDRVFTGDTLFIRGTGRTDFQNGDARRAYRSLFERLLKLPDETRVYPGHDYKGDTVSTIGEERAWNPRLQVGSADEYAALMDNLKLPNPSMMDMAVPANLSLGMSQREVEARGWALGCAELRERIGAAEMLLVDLRESGERERHGLIPGSVHVPYDEVERSVSAGGLLHEMLAGSDREVVFYCAFGERSAMAVQRAQARGVAHARHLRGGLDAWRRAGGTIEAASA